MKLSKSQYKQIVSTLNKANRKDLVEAMSVEVKAEVLNTEVLNSIKTGCLRAAAIIDKGSYKLKAISKKIDRDPEYYDVATLASDLRSALSSLNNEVGTARSYFGKKLGEHI